MNNIYESKSWDNERSMHPGGIELTKKLFNNSTLKSGKALDIGCGKGESLNFLKENGFKAYGLDLSKKFKIENKSNYNNTEFTNWDLNNEERLPFEDSYFDLILVECVLNLLDNREYILSEINRILSDKGLLLINDLMTLEDKNMGNLYTLKNWKNAIDTSGFNIIYLEEEREILKQFILKNLWEGNNICERVCTPKDANINNMSYISIIGEK